MPGQELFQYVDEDGAARAIDSADVNDYLREARGADFTRQGLPHLGTAPCSRRRRCGEWTWAADPREGGNRAGGRPRWPSR